MEGGAAINIQHRLFRIMLKEEKLSCTRDNVYLFLKRYRYSVSSMTIMTVSDKKGMSFQSTTLSGKINYSGQGGGKEIRMDPIVQYCRDVVNSNWVMADQRPSKGGRDSMYSFGWMCYVPQSGSLI